MAKRTRDIIRDRAETAAKAVAVACTEIKLIIDMYGDRDIPERAYCIQVLCALDQVHTFTNDLVAKL